MLCIQETKIQNDQLTDALKHVGEYHSYFSQAEKKGYSGVAIYTKHRPVAIIEGIGTEEFDGEGRVLTIELETCFVTSVYVPNSQPGLKRLDYRLRFNDALFSFLEGLNDSKPVILCGDLNVAHREIDITNPKANELNPGFYIEERNKFSRLLEKGFVDTFRNAHPDTIKYSWWSYRFNARAKNIGWRLDYIVVSEDISGAVEQAFIRDDIHGSDHCPVGIILGDLS